MITTRNTSNDSGQRSQGRSRGRNAWLIGVVAVAGLVAIGVAAWINDDDRSTTFPLVLSTGEGEAMASCLPFDVEILATMTHAFAGTVTAVEAETIMLRVDDWYTDGDASTIELRTIGDAQALVGGFPLEVGEQYLLSASDDALSYCGYSGPFTLELEEAFTTAFGSA